MRPTTTPAATSPGRPGYRRFALVAVVVAVAAGGGVLGYRSHTRSEERRAALALAENGPTDSALPALLRCLDRDPDDPAVLAAVVRTLTRAGAAPPELEPYTERWQRAAPADPAAARARLDALQRMERWAEAVDAAQRVLELSPTDHAVRQELAGFYLRLGRHEEAVREFRRLLDSSPFPRDDLLVDLARAESEWGHPAEAARALDEVLARHPDHPAALFFRGVVYRQAGDDAAAVTVFRKVKARSPDERILLLHHHGQSLTRLGKTDEAKRAFDELTRLQDARLFAADARHRPGDRALALRAASDYLATGWPEEARQLLEAYISVSKPDREVLTVLADSCDRMGDPNAARRIRAEAARLP